MATGKIVVLSLLISQAVSAPSGCTELCTSSYQRSYRGESSSGYQDHAGLTQASLIAENTKPGNWTEHNRYKTDGGRGNVYEERGQVVQGPKTIRYYRKNYTSSYSSEHPSGWTSVSQQRNGNARATGGSEYRRGWSQSELENSNSQMAIGGELSSGSQHSEYENVQSQRVNSITSSGGTSARLEDFGEYHEGSQQHSGHLQGYQQSSTEPGNWKRVNSYKTDGGNGQVHEEEGQYQTGPRRVRYYRRNYTSGYSTGGPVGHGLPEPVVGADMMQEIEKMRQQFHSASDWRTSGSSLNLNGHNVQPEGVITDHQVDQGQTVEGLSLGQDRVPALYPAPTQGGLVSESRSAFQKHESYVTKMQPIYHAAPTPVSHVDANYRRSHYNRETEQGRLDQFRGAEDMNQHQSAILDNQMIYNGGHRLTALPSAGTDQGSRFREEWQSSSHVREGTNSQAAQQAGYNYRNQYNNRHGSYHTGQTHESHVSQLEGDSLQTTQHNVAPEKLLNGVINIGRDADCTQEAQQMQYRTQYHRSYKRGANYDEQHQQSQDITQQNQEFGQLHDQRSDSQRDDDDMQQTGHIEFGQQSEDLTQQNEDLTQQTTGNLESGQQHLEDFSQQNQDLIQQTSGKLEFGQQDDQQQHQQHSEDLTQQDEDLTQQTSGKLEFGQQHDQQQHHQHSEDFTQQDEDLTQQTSGKLEFGQQHDQQQHHQHSEDLTQQNEDLTQQTGGKLEFGQQQDQQHSEDLTQQNEDLTQQTSGKLEFGQQHDQQQHHQHSEDFTQQDEDLTQQTSGKLEFGQQHDQQQHHQHSEDLTQQNEDLTQQTSGKLEFGQQHDQQQHHQHSEDLTQQNEDLTQQTSGKLEFGQHDQQHSEDFTQQTSGKLEFGQQQGQQHQHADDFTQQSSDDDFMQQTGHLELGQQSQQPWGQDIDGQQHEDFTQQTQDLTQQTDQDLEFGQQSQYPWKPSAHSQHHGTVGKLEFGQETQRTEADDMMKPTTRNPEFGHPQRGQRPKNGQSGSEGKLEFGQQLPGQSSEHAGKPEFGQPEQFPPEFHQTSNSEFPGLPDSYSQQSGYEFDGPPPTRYPSYDNSYEPSQHESGKLEVGQQTQDYHPWSPNHNQEGMHQNNEDLTQQVGKWEFGPYYRTPYRPYPAADSEKDKDTNKDGPVIPLAGFGQTSDQVINRESQHAESVPPKPAQKPKPRPRYTRPVQEQNPSAPNNQNVQEHESTEGGDTPVIDLSPLNPNVDIEADTDDAERANSRGDQGPGTSTTTIKPNDLGQRTPVNSYSMSRGHTEHSSWMHNSNDATVGVQWHYAYHPSDLTNSEPTSSHYPGRSYGLFTPYGPTVVEPGQERPTYWTPAPEPTSRPPPPSGVKTSRRHRPVSRYWRNMYSTQNPLGDNYNELQNQQQNGESLDTIQKPRQAWHLESGMKPGSLQQQESTTGTIGIEPRILSAFAVPHGVRPNEYPDGAMPDPSVTLPPVNNEDPWDIRNVARTVPTTEPTTTTTEPTTTTPAPTTTPRPSFWNRVGSEIHKTARKVEDTFKNIFSGK